MLSRRTVISTGLWATAAPAFAAAGDYAAALERAYGGPFAPDKAFARLRAAAAAAQARAGSLLRAQGLASGSVGERLAAFAQDGAFLYADDGAGRERAMAEMNARLAGLKPKLAVAFGDLPIAPADVRRMSRADEAAGRGGYRVAPKDGVAGAYFVDLHAIRARPSWSLPTVAFHEVTPGHLLQMPLEASAHPPAERVKRSGAYFEAWATYAEQLAADLGAYTDDRPGEIGYLHWRLFRLGRGIADIGLGAMGWSRERAADEMRALQGFDAAFVTIAADVERIAAAPGKVAAEALGALDLADWRPKPRAKWPAYHRAVLADGPWGFSDLKARVARAI
jgi:uncharacterized protein (DUF885 family)